MRTPSRRMPPARGQPRSVLAAGALSILAVGTLAILCWLLPWPLTLILAAMVVFVSLRERRHFRKLAAAREGESICTFTRSFDCLKVDTWIIRAVYEGFRAHTGIAVRPGDRWAEDLHIDEQDFEDIVEEIARRAGRSMRDCEKNPLFGNVVTVGGLVTFLSRQPLTSTGPSSPDGPRSTR